MCARPTLPGPAPSPFTGACTGMQGPVLVRTGSRPSLLVSSCPTASRLPDPVGKGLLSLAREEGPLWFSLVVRVCEWSPGMDVVSSCWAEAREGGLGVAGLCP